MLQRNVKGVLILMRLLKKIIEPFRRHIEECNKVEELLEKENIKIYKEKKMAYANTETKKIYGCKRGSKTYYHEEGHLKFEENKGGYKIRAIQDLSIKGLLFSTAFGVIYNHSIITTFILLLILLSIITEMYEEAWCWIYASKKIKEVKESDKNKEISKQV
jgi:hypothetical protein